jgi:5'-methylthioadenosine phosphorylase
MTSTSASAASPAAGPIALIGGSSFLESHLLSSFKPLTVHTAHGPAIVHSNSSSSLYFIQRHAANPAQTYSPPHLINKRAIVAALQQLQVTVVVGFGSVGSLRRDIPVGQLLVPDDFYDTEPVSLFEYDKRGHMSAAQRTH